VILFICFLLSISAAFEFKLDMKEQSCASSVSVVDNNARLMRNQSENVNDGNWTAKLSHKMDNDHIFANNSTSQGVNDGVREIQCPSVSDYYRYFWGSTLTTICV
jgi:hypothetical protein